MHFSPCLFIILFIAMLAIIFLRFSNYRFPTHLKSQVTRCVWSFISTAFHELFDYWELLSFVFSLCWALSSKTFFKTLVKPVTKLICELAVCQFYQSRAPKTNRGLTCARFPALHAVCMFPPFEIWLVRCAGFCLLWLVISVLVLIG